MKSDVLGNDSSVCVGKTHPFVEEMPLLMMHNQIMSR